MNIQYQFCETSLLLMCGVVWGGSYDHTASYEQQKLKESLLKTENRVKLTLLFGNSSH